MSQRVGENASNICCDHEPIPLLVLARASAIRRRQKRGFRHVVLAGPEGLGALGMPVGEREGLDQLSDQFL